MDGFIGLNPKEAATQIMNFYEMCSEIGVKFSTEGFGEFHNALRKSWCSPRAVEFGKKELPKLLMIAYDIQKVAAIICRKANDAYNKMAVTQGLPTITCSDNYQAMLERGGNATLGDMTGLDAASNYEIAGGGEYLLEVSPEGIVGVNKENVILALGNLKHTVAITMNRLNCLPKDIALYDPSGDLLTAYGIIIKEMISELESVIHSVNNELFTALEGEVERVELAKEQAVEAMSA